MTAEAERYLRLLAEVELRRNETEGRLRAVANVLSWAGAIDDGIADTIVDGYITARRLRGLPQSARRITGPLRLRRIGTPYTGAVRVVPVGVTLPGRFQPLRLLALTLAPGHAVMLTMAGLIDTGGRPDRDQLPIGPYGPSDPDLGLMFTGDDGTRYPHTMIGGGTSDGAWWRQDLLLPAAAGAGRWLDITTAAEDSASARIRLADGVSAAGRVSAADRRPAGEPDRDWRPAAASHATDTGWLLDNIAAAQLWLAVSSPTPAPASAALQWQAQLEAMAGAIRDVGLGPGRSAALARYAALSRRLAGNEATGPERDKLPPAWADVLADRGPDAGREDVYPGVAVLPPLDGVRFAVTGVGSATGSATLRVVGWADQPGRAQLMATVLFSWWARDDAGHWHVGRPYRAGLAHSLTPLDVVLVPALLPGVQTLAVSVAGRGGTVRATVPLTGS